MEEALEIAKQYPNNSGSILIEGIEFAERNGLVCKIIHSSIPELKKIIDSGIPPIVILPGIPEIEQGSRIALLCADNQYPHLPNLRVSLWHDSCEKLEPGHPRASRNVIAWLQWATYSS